MSKTRKPPTPQPLPVELTAAERPGPGAVMFVNNTSLVSLERELARRGVYRCSLILTKDGFYAHMQLRDVVCLDGHVPAVESSRLKTLSMAINDACSKLDDEWRRSICVYDVDGRLRGQYPHSSVGKLAAEKQRNRLGSGATLQVPQ